MAHRYRLYPTTDQTAVLARHCADARFVWNLALEQANCWRRGRSASPGNKERMRQLTEARQASAWLAEGSASVLQQALRDFDRAMRNWWSGTHHRPTWRKAAVNEGFCVRDLSVHKLNGRWAELAVRKAGRVRFRLSRPVPADAKSARVTLDRAGRWHVSFQSIPPLIAGPQRGEVVGVDRGVANTIALSTGQLLSTPPPEWAELARLQRRLSRQQKGSKRRERTRARIGRLRGRETDRRNDWIEKVTTDLACRFDVVRVENLRTGDMTRSARGSVDHPGRNVAAKSGLNRRILAQGWARFARRLKDKIDDRLELVDPAFTSQTCSACGYRHANCRESQARFACRSCGMVEHADVNAARNIAAGRAVSGRGGNGAIGPPNEASTTQVA